MVANAMDKTKDKKYEVLENVDIVKIANAPALWDTIHVKKSTARPLEYLFKWKIFCLY